MLNVCYVIDELIASGGTELQLRGLVDALDRRQVTPHVAELFGALDRDPDTVAPPMELDRCGRLALASRGFSHPSIVPQVRRFQRYLDEHRVDVVQTFWQDSTVFGALALMGRPRVAMLTSFRDLGFWRNRKMNMLMRLAYRRCDGFLANSTAVRDHFAACDGLDPRRIRVIYNGTDAAGFPFAPVDPARPRIVFLGNLNRNVKRLDLFLDAADTVADAVPGAEFLILGHGHLRPQFEARAARLRCADRVRFLGGVPDPRPVLATAAVGVNCSDSEGFSNAILEFMLTGCGVVATAVGGNSELVQDGVTGMLVPPDDAAALGAGIVKLLSAPADYAAMVAAARRRVEALCSWESCVADHMTAYQDVIASRQQRSSAAPSSA